jgi:hypothetical protein
MLAVSKKEEMDEIEIVMDLPVVPEAPSKDSYVYLDFLREGRVVFDSWEALVKWFIPSYKRVFHKIEEGKGFFFKQDRRSGDCSQVEKLKINFKYKIIAMKNNNLVTLLQNITFSNLIENLYDQLPSYTNVAYKPRGHNLCKDEYNTWVEFVGWEETIEDDENKNLIKFLDYLKDIICNRNDECYKYILSWLRHTILKPWQKTEICIFLQSPQGCGKGVFFRFLREFVYGKHCSGAVCGLAPLSQKHNTIMASKSFMCVDELPCTSGEFHGQFEKMKNYITEDVIFVEPKGKEPYNVDNHCNFIMASNNVHSVKIEDSDRRYHCQVVSSEKRGSQHFQYWTTLCDAIMNEKTGKLFCKYLRDMDKATIVNLRNIPETTLRSELKKNSQPTSKKFLDDLLAGEVKFNEKIYFIEPFKHSVLGIIKFGIDRDSFYNLYKDWCTNTGEKAVKQKVFVASLAESIKPVRVTSKKQRYSMFNLESLGYKSNISKSKKNF